MAMQVGKVAGSLSRGRTMLVCGSLVAALCSTAGFAFAVPSALDARSVFDSAVADATLPQESGAGEGSSTTPGGSEEMHDAAQPSGPSLAAAPDKPEGTDDGQAAKGAADKDDQAEEGEREDEASGEGAASGATAAADSPTVTVRQYSSAPSSSSSGQSGTSGSSSESPGDTASASNDDSGSSASAESPAVDPEQEAYDKRHEAAWARMQEMAMPASNVYAVLSNVFASLPVAWTEGGFTTEGIAAWADASLALADASSCIATCDAYLADYGADEFPDLASQAAVWTERWQNLRSAANLLATFCGNYVNCPDRANPNEWEWTCTSCYTSVLSGHVWSVPVSGGFYGGKLDYLETDAEIAARL